MKFAVKNKKGANIQQIILLLAALLVFVIIILLVVLLKDNLNVESVKDIIFSAQELLN